MGSIDFDIPLWLIIAFVVFGAAWPLILAAGGTAIVSLIVAAAAKSALALKVAAVAAAVFFSPLIIGVIGEPLYKAAAAHDDSAHSEWKEDTPLIRAVKNQDEKKVAKLLEKGEDPNGFSEYENRTPLSESCKEYDDEEKADRITALLLDAGADANKKIKFKNDAMENAVVSGRHGAIRLLCSRGYEFSEADGKWNDIVEFAVKNERYEEACILLELGAVPLERYEFDFLEEYTIFMYILEESIFFIHDSNETEEQKENRLRTEKEKVTVLSRLFTLLLEKGLDVNARTNDHRKATALILLADSYMTTRNDAPKLPLAKILLDGGADVNIQNAYGKTALMFFAEISWATKITDAVNWIRLLVSYGADKTLRDENGFSALDYFHRSCRRNDCKEAEIPVYDEIERLLTPDTAADEKQVPEMERIANERTQSANIAKSEFTGSRHTALSDIEDDW